MMAAQSIQLGHSVPLSETRQACDGDGLADSIDSWACTLASPTRQVRL